MYSRVFKDISKIPDSPEDAAVYLFERGLKVVPFSITQKDSGSHIKRPTLLWKDGSYGTIKKSGKPVKQKKDAVKTVDVKTVSDKPGVASISPSKESKPKERNEISCHLRNNHKFPYV